VPGGKRLGVIGVAVLALAVPAPAWAAPPVNDDFADATLIKGATGIVSDTNTYATLQETEPFEFPAPGGGCCTVWYRWVAPADGTTTIDTISEYGGATFLEVFSGSSVTALTKLAESGYSPTYNYKSRLAVTVEEGSTYRIRVSGASYGRDFLMSWRLVTGPASPVNDNFADAWAISGARGAVAGDNTGATAEEDEPQAQAGQEAYGANSIWYEWTAPADGTATVSTEGSVDWTQLAIFTGATLADLERVTALPHEASTFGVRFAAEGGTTYRLFIATRFDPGPITLNWNLEGGPPPSNDALANSIALTGASGSVTGTTTGATKESISTYPYYDEGHLLHGGNDGARSVWYTWTAPSAGAVVFDTAGSSLDTLLSVYTYQPDDTIATINKISANDNTRGDLTSRVAFIAWEGASYRIAVDSYAQRSGGFVLSWGDSVPAAVDAPETTISGAPPHLDKSGDRQFDLSASELESVIECWVDDQPHRDCGTVAQLPALSQGTHTFTARALDVSGNIDPTPATWTWTYDSEGPVATGPTESLRAGSQLGITSVPVRVAWSISDAVSGVSTYSLWELSSDVWEWQKVALPQETSTSVLRRLTPSETYQFQVRALDKAGNQGGGTGPQFELEARQENAAELTYSGTWTPRRVQSAYGGYLKYTSARGAEATCSFTGRGGALVAPKGPNRGKAAIYVDDAFVKNIDLYAAGSKPRIIVFSRSWADAGAHTISLKALRAKRSASTGRRVDLDACVFLG